MAIVSETRPGNVPNGSAVSSYAVLSGGTLQAISSSIPTFGAANCCNAITPDGRFVYVLNADDFNEVWVCDRREWSFVSSSWYSGCGESGRRHKPGYHRQWSMRFLYTLNSCNGIIGIFAIQADGTLKNAGSAGGITPVCRIQRDRSKLARLDARR